MLGLEFVFKSLNEQSNQEIIVKFMWLVLEANKSLNKPKLLHYTEVTKNCTTLIKVV